MPHFYVHPENIDGKTFRITGEDVRYLAVVRRCVPGDRIKIFDGKGITMMCVIDSVSKEEIAGTILKKEEHEKAVVRLCLYTAVPKGNRFDWLVEKCAELGVAKLIPVLTERSSVREVTGAKLERWQRLSKAASQQCGRSDLLEVSKQIEFSEALKNLQPGALNLIPWESEETVTLKDAFKLNSGAKEVNVFIGPEGGFSVGEVDLALKHKLVSVTLGDSILRVETANLLSTILVLSIFGEYEKK